MLNTTLAFVWGIWHDSCTYLQLIVALSRTLKMVELHLLTHCLGPELPTPVTLGMLLLEIQLEPVKSMKGGLVQHFAKVSKKHSSRGNFMFSL